MSSPSQAITLDIAALSGIMGAMSIACWVVVFTPQIIKNFRRGSAEGLSVAFILVWLAGDVFNIIGSFLQRVLPTMIVVAIYYTVADIVLLAQCFYYKGFTLSDTVKERDDEEPPREPTETSHISPRSDERHGIEHIEDGRRSSLHSFTGQLPTDGTHLSPATPELVDDPPLATTEAGPHSAVKSVLLNLAAVVLVCLAGFMGWYFTRKPPSSHTAANDSDSALHFNIPGQICGYICCAFYLGSRLPQLYLNYKRRSTDGISMLFFIFAWLGNLTYVISILAYEPHCRGNNGQCLPGEAVSIYGRYMLVNLSWLLGSFVTLLLDGGIFFQYFSYRKKDASEGEAS